MHRSNSDHDNHDLALIAGHAAGDLAVSERISADTLLRSCTDCAELRRDLLAIAAATRALPTTASASRDYRLDAAQAARLRRGSWLRSILRPFGAARSGVRPMAAAMTSLGLAGLLVTTILPGLFGSAASAPTSERDRLAAGLPAPTSAPAQQPIAAGSSAGAGEVQAAGQPSGRTYDQLTGAKSSQEPNDMPPDVALGQPGSHVPAPGGTPTDTSSVSSPLPNPIVLGSLALLLIGVTLFGLRFAARRVR